MEVIFLPDAKEDLSFWQKTGNRSILKKISDLISAIKLDPFQGIGKPEPLKHQLVGFWSRRINQEHRLVYEVIDQKILVHSLKGHYTK